MGPIWGRQDPGGPHVGPMNFAIWAVTITVRFRYLCAWLDFQDQMFNRFNTLRPRQMPTIFETMFSNALSWMRMHEFRLKFHWRLFPSVELTKCMPALVQIMDWRRLGDKLLSKPMMFTLLTHKSVTRPQWANSTEYILLFPTWYFTDKITRK